MVLTLAAPDPLASGEQTHWPRARHRRARLTNSANMVEGGIAISRDGA